MNDRNRLRRVPSGGPSKYSPLVAAKKRAAKKTKTTAGRPELAARPMPWERKGEPYAEGKALVDSLPDVWTWDAPQRWAMHQIEQAALDMASRHPSEPPEARALWEKIDALRHVARAVSMGQATAEQRATLARVLRADMVAGYKREPGDSVLKVRIVLRAIAMGSREYRDRSARAGLAAPPEPYSSRVVALLRREWAPRWPSDELMSEALEALVAEAIRSFHVPGGGRGRAGGISHLRALLTFLGVQVTTRTIQIARQGMSDE